MMSNSVGFFSKFTRGTGNLSFAVKDTIDVSGYPTQAGSRVFLHAPPAARNARIVQQFLDDGCQLLGKTMLHELAFGVTGINHWGGTPVNYSFPDIIPGGSSSGSATVVAAGCVDFAIGTDTGGSVRMPAACCGVVGLKPTWGVISRDGVSPKHSSLDCVGFFTQTCGTLLQVMEKAQGIVADRSISLPAIGVMKGHATEAIDALLAQRLQPLIAAATTVDLTYFTEAHQAGLTLISHENWQAYASIIDAEGISPDVVTRIRAGSAVTAAELAYAEAVREKFSDALDHQLAETPLIILPTLPELPPTLSEASDPLNVVNLTRLIRPFNLSGHPAMSLPIGVIDGRPVAMQLITHKNHDLNLCVYAKKLVESFT